jgi:hypothetical protein
VGTYPLKEKKMRCDGCERGCWMCDKEKFIEFARSQGQKPANPPFLRLIKEPDYPSVFLGIWKYEIGIGWPRENFTIAGHRVSRFYIQLHFGEDLEWNQRFNSWTRYYE